MKGTKITSVTEKINVYKSNWTNNMNPMPRNELTWIFKNYTKRREKSRKPHEEWWTAEMRGDRIEIGIFLLELHDDEM